MEACPCEEVEAILFKDLEDNFQHLFDINNKSLIAPLDSQKGLLVQNMIFI